MISYAIGDIVIIRAVFDGAYQIREGRISGIDYKNEMYHGTFGKYEYSFMEDEIIKRVDR